MRAWRLCIREILMKVDRAIILVRRLISMGDHDQEVSEQQDNLLYAFARTTLTRLKTLVEPLGAIPVQIRYYVSFGEDSSARTAIQTKNDCNYSGVLQGLPD